MKPQIYLLKLCSLVYSTQMICHLKPFLQKLLTIVIRIAWFDIVQHANNSYHVKNHKWRKSCGIDSNRRDSTSSIWIAMIQWSIINFSLFCFSFTYSCQISLKGTEGVHLDSSIGLFSFFRNQDSTKSLTPCTLFDCSIGSFFLLKSRLHTLTLSLSTIYWLDLLLYF